MKTKYNEVTEVRLKIKPLAPAEVKVLSDKGINFHNN